MNTSETTPTSDPRTFLERALDQTERLLAGVTQDTAGLPTGCAEFDVEALSSHLLAVVNRLEVILTSGTFEGTPVTWPHASDPLPEFHRLRASLQPHVEAADLDASVTMPWGPSTIRGALDSYAGEFTVHGWDLAQGLGSVSALDPDLATAALHGFRQKLPQGERPDFIPFGDEVVVPASAGPYERLVAFTGRRP